MTEPPSRQSLFGIGGATAVLIVWWLALPIRLGVGNDGASSAQCLTMADRPPAPGAATIVQLERCSTVIPDDVELLADLAAAYESAGRVDDAQAAYQRVLAIDREYAEVHARLAALLLARGDAATAKMHAELALGLQPNRRAVVELIERASQMEAANR